MLSLFYLPTATNTLESFRPPFSKGGAHPTRVALVAPRKARKFPHRRSSGAHCYAVVRMRRLSFVSFSFAPLLPKEKRRTIKSNLM